MSKKSNKTSKGYKIKNTSPDQGHRRNHKKRQTPEESKGGNEEKTSPRRKPNRHRSKRSEAGRNGDDNYGAQSPQIVINIGRGHPKVEPETYDAAALLQSVLGAVEPKLEEGLKELAEAITPGTESEAARAIRAVGRHLAEALRAGVVEGMQVRQRHLAQLAVIDRAAAQARNLSGLQGRISAEIEHAGLRRVCELEDLSPFNLASTSEDSLQGEATFELVTPAYVEADSGRVVERGWIKVAEPAPAPAGKTHGRVSREHRDKRHNTEEEAPPSTPENLPEPGDQPAPATHAHEEDKRSDRRHDPADEGVPTQQRHSESPGQERQPARPKAESDEGNVDERGGQRRRPAPRAPGAVPVTRARSRRIATDQTSKTKEQAPRRSK
jgi:hypothetical protein